MRCSISLLIRGLASAPVAPPLGGAGTGGTGLGRRSELIRLGRGFGGLSGASTGSEKGAAAPASESRERRLKAAVEDEHDEEDEVEEDDPPSSERVRRAVGGGSRGFGKS